MAAWHRSRKADLGLRFMGMILCGLAYLAVSQLVAIHPPAPPRLAGIMAYGLATAGVLCGIAGGALTMLGHHLFDEIEVSPRWRQRDIGQASTRDR